MYIIRSAEFVKSGTNASHYPEPLKSEYLFLGRSNVGKSSLINAIVNRKNLARTSSEPGKTITMNFFNINDEIYLVDAPGYGYARRSQTQIAQFQAMLLDYIQTRESLKRIFMLVDMKVGATKDDIEVYQSIRNAGYVVTILLTKQDKLNQSERSKNIQMIKAQLNDAEVEMIPTSSESKRGIEKIHTLFEEDLHE
ncbi:ribosome biogenesis GTP-binding protein YihA/YsxC [Acholeplasma vituli]|uniref:Probable GTP-binding protein EngB n=1 Tax=Paracholeplasma vituli TaxID=69473 RepID=A0ABT2PVS9_9MOLU|nr:ribosome biogenesis GTP-binding protein YihA/YsxC [Paracholeplasma vituli]MCU0105059.1 ribosome biogenesis GTP-binding protein YihA/YsxC [Paracholeplasma vituli]